VQLAPSAFRHDVPVDDIRHAVEHAIAMRELDDLDMYIGPARDGALLEIGISTREPLDGWVVHAMPARPRFLPGAP
jgi:hypothetical protein